MFMDCHSVCCHPRASPALCVSWRFLFRKSFSVSSKWWFCSCFESFMLNARDLSDIFQLYCASNSLTRPFLILIFFLHPHNLFPSLKSLWKFWQSLIHYFAQFSCLNTLHRLCLISIHFATYPLLPNWKTTCVITPSKLFGVPTMQVGKMWLLPNFCFSDFSFSLWVGKGAIILKHVWWKFHGHSASVRYFWDCCCYFLS